MTTPPVSPREHLAWLIWCYSEGYTNPIDRACHTNWMGDDPATLTDDDVRTQRGLLGMADEVLALMAGGGAPPGRANEGPLMRYRVIVWRESQPGLEPDFGHPPMLDQEFNFSESAHKVVDIFTQAIEQAVAEGGQAERGYTVPGDDPDRAEYNDDWDGKDMDPHYGDGEPG